MAFQRSLFPGAYEVQDAALQALEDRLDTGRALELVERARERDPELVGLDRVEAALVWLHEQLAGRAPDGESLARAWRALPRARHDGSLRADSASFLDPILASHALRQAGSSPFVDRAESVHVGALYLLRGRPKDARHLLLETLYRTHRERADLWGALGDACLLEERGDEANACYVRALVISARDLDLFRLRDERLAQLHHRLAARHDEAASRELLLSEAWLAGALSIPPANDWVDPELLASLRARTSPPSPSPGQRWRRFGLLLYVDRSRPPGEVSAEDREEMLSLDPELFGRYMEACRRTERAATRTFDARAT